MTSSRKLCLLFALAAIGLAAMGGSAGASTFTSPAGTAFTGWLLGKPTAGHFVFDSAAGSVTTECSSRPMEFAAEVHGSTVTAKGTERLALFEKCTNSKELTTLNRGYLEFHAIGNGNATITSTNLEFTSNTTVSLPGYHCKYKTNNSHFGTFTGSKSTGGNAVIDLAGAVIPRTEGSHPFCGNIEITAGSYKIETPGYLDIS